MTGSRGRWPTWNTRFLIEGWQCLATPRRAAGARAQAHDHMGGLRSDSPGAAGGRQLFTAEVLMLREVTYHELFFIHLRAAG